tara:strand:- start:1733 stop:3142 length:1410 start_codon:yes stop_codon:yes gene_type:complete
MKSLIKNNLLIVVFIPLIFNSLSNLFSGKNDFLHYLFGNKIIILAILISSLFYYQISKLINRALKLHSISLSLILFLTSFYIFNLIFLPFLKEISFKTTLLVVFTLWISFLTFKTDKKIEIIKVLALYVGSLIFNSRFYIELSNLSGFKELNTDVPVQWYELANMISSENYYFAFTNNIIEGQTLAISYVQSLLFNLNFYFYEFSYIRLNSNLIIIFAVFLIYDLNLSKHDKIIASVTLVLFILNSDWLTYLFMDSLMLEGLVGLIFATFLINIKSYIFEKSNLNSYLFFFLFSFLFFTKQFVSTISLILLIFLLIKYKNLRLLIGLIPYFINRVYTNVYIPDSKEFELLKGTSIKELLLDILTFDNLAIENVSHIISQLLIDKPYVYILLIFSIVNFLRLLLNLRSTESFTLNVSLFAIVINFVFIFSLYIVWWKDFGIQSSHRYTLNLFLLLFYSLLMNINLFKKEV